MKNETKKIIYLSLFGGFLIGLLLVGMAIIAAQGQELRENAKKAVRVPWFGSTMVFSDNTKNAKVKIYARN